MPVDVSTKMQFMSKELLEKFARKIAPYRDLWKSVRLVCLAARTGEAWIVLAVRVSFSEALPVQSVTLRPTEDFIALSLDMPIGALGQVLYNLLIDCFIQIETNSACIKAYLSRAHAGLPPGPVGNISWFGVVEHERCESLSEHGTTRPAVTITAWGERRYEVLSTDSLREVNSRLRLGDPAFDGLNDLIVQWVPGVEVAHESQASIQVVAPIPFQMEYAEPGRLLVHGPGSAGRNLRVRLFFRPQGIRQLELSECASNDEAVSQGITTWGSPIDWPKDSLRAKIVLFLGDQEIDSFEVKRWPHSASHLAAMNVFFDPEHKRLRDALLGPANRTKENFEVATVRLLNLLGIPVIWYGKIAAESRPDLAGLVAQNKNRLIVLGECTRERPDAKFSGLSERARELHDSFSGEIGVLPIVFTCANTTESELEKAIEHRVALIGREDLEVLLGFLQAPRNPSEVLGFLQTMRPSNSPFSAYIVGYRPKK